MLFVILWPEQFCGPSDGSIFCLRVVMWCVQSDTFPSIVGVLHTLLTSLN